MHKRFLESMKKYLKQRKAKVQTAMKLDPDCWDKPSPVVKREKDVVTGKRILSKQKARTPKASNKQLNLGRT